MAGQPAAGQGRRRLRAAAIAPTLDLSRSALFVSRRARIVGCERSPSFPRAGPTSGPDSEASLEQVPKDLVTGATVMTMLDMRGGAFNDAVRKGLIKPESAVPGKGRSTAVRLYRLAEVERFRRARAAKT